MVIIRIVAIAFLPSIRIRVVVVICSCVKLFSLKRIPGVARMSKSKRLQLFFGYWVHISKITPEALSIIGKNVTRPLNFQIVRLLFVEIIEIMFDIALSA